MGARAWVVAAIIAVLALALFIMPFLAPLAPSGQLEQSLAKLSLTSDGGVAGERISVELDLTGTFVPGHSYAVNGSGHYENLELACTLAVEYENAEDVVINYVRIRAEDCLDGSYYTYPLASSVAVNTNPYQDEFSITKSISDHLFLDVSADEDADGYYWVRYFIAVKVSGTGSYSGDPLVVVIDYTWFNTYYYCYIPPGGGLDGSISWVVWGTSTAGLIVLAVLAFWWARRVIRRGARA